MARVCSLCHSSTVDSLNLGNMHTVDGYSVHHFCLLFAPYLAQNGGDDEGIEGFLIEDIKIELQRCRNKVCCYCSGSGAAALCQSLSCSRQFHLKCALDNNAQISFIGRFSVYCERHRRCQNTVPRDPTEPCAICSEPNSDNPLLTICTPCCGHLFHKHCLQRMAQSWGYFFNCPVCRDKNHRSGFLKHMKCFGVYVPQRDASWECVPNAYTDLLARSVQCDQRFCLCDSGRSHSVNRDRRWHMVLCDACGSFGSHWLCAGARGRPPAAQLAGDDIQRPGQQQQRRQWHCHVCVAALGDSSSSRSLVTVRRLLEAGELGPRPRSFHDALGPVTWRQLMQNVDDPRQLLKFTVSHSGQLQLSTRPLSDPLWPDHVIPPQSLSFDAASFLPVVRVTRVQVSGRDGRRSAGGPVSRRLSGRAHRSSDLANSYHVSVYDSSSSTDCVLSRSSSSGRLPLRHPRTGRFRRSATSSTGSVDAAHCRTPALSKDSQFVENGSPAAAAAGADGAAAGGRVSSGALSPDSWSQCAGDVDGDRRQVSVGPSAGRLLKRRASSSPPECRLSVKMCPERATRDGNHHHLHHSGCGDDGDGGVNTGSHSLPPTKRRRLRVLSSPVYSPSPPRNCVRGLDVRERCRLELSFAVTAGRRRRHPCDTLAACSSASAGATLRPDQQTQSDTESLVASSAPDRAPPTVCRVTPYRHEPSSTDAPQPLTQRDTFSQITTERSRVQTDTASSDFAPADSAAAAASAAATTISAPATGAAVAKQSVSSVTRSATPARRHCSRQTQLSSRRTCRDPVEPPPQRTVLASVNSCRARSTDLKPAAAAAPSAAKHHSAWYFSGLDCSSPVTRSRPAAQRRHRRCLRRELATAHERLVQITLEQMWSGGHT